MELLKIENYYKDKIEEKDELRIKLLEEKELNLYLSEKIEEINNELEKILFEKNSYIEKQKSFYIRNIILSVILSFILGVTISGTYTYSLYKNRNIANKFSQNKSALTEESGFEAVSSDSWDPVETEARLSREISVVLARDKLLKTEREGGQPGRVADSVVQE